MFSSVRAPHSFPLTRTIRHRAITHLDMSTCGLESYHRFFIACRLAFTDGEFGGRCSGAPPPAHGAAPAAAVSGISPYSAGGRLGRSLALRCPYGNRYTGTGQDAPAAAAAAAAAAAPFHPAADHGRHLPLSRVCQIQVCAGAVQCHVPPLGHGHERVRVLRLLR